MSEWGAAVLGWYTRGQRPIKVLNAGAKGLEGVSRASWVPALSLPGLPCFACLKDLVPPGHVGSSEAQYIRGTVASRAHAAGE